jgi:hypothetical protein
VEVADRHRPALSELSNLLEHQVPQPVAARVVAHPAGLEGCVLPVVGEDQKAPVVLLTGGADHLLGEDVNIGHRRRAKRADRLDPAARGGARLRSAAEAAEPALGLMDDEHLCHRAGSPAVRIATLLAPFAMERATAGTDVRLRAALIEARRAPAGPFGVLILVLALRDEHVREPHKPDAVGLRIGRREPVGALTGSLAAHRSAAFGDVRMEVGAAVVLPARAADGDSEHGRRHAVGIA